MLENLLELGGRFRVPTQGDQSLAADKAECTTEFPGCAVTVGSLQDCMELIIDAQAVCTEASLTAAMANANCQSVGAAGCFN